MIEEEVDIDSYKRWLVMEKLEHAQELIWSHKFYADEHREHLRDHLGKAASILKTSFS